MNGADETKDYLSPASPSEIAEALIHGLRYDGRRRVHDADELMARVVAERLVEHLERSGFVLCRRPAAPQPDATPHRHPRGR